MPKIRSMPCLVTPVSWATPALLMSTSILSVSPNREGNWRTLSRSARSSGLCSNTGPFVNSARISSITVWVFSLLRVAK